MRNPPLPRRAAPTTTAFGSIALVAAFALPQTALAGPPGMGPGGPGQMGPGAGPPGAGGDEKDGPAEEAPKDKQSLRPVEPVPAEPPRARRVQMFEIHGDLRLRTDYFSNLHLGVSSDFGGTGAVVPVSDYDFVPPTESIDAVGQGVNCVERRVGNVRAQNRCGNQRPTFGSGNMRLRLNPTFHATENVRVHTTIDLLDNVVLGSSPNAFAPDHFAAQSRTQIPLEDLGGVGDTINVKRAWGEFHFGFGLDVEFGRMPQHWGMGMLWNHGNGTPRMERGDLIRAIDTDYGDSVDQVKLSYGFGTDPRTSHVLSASYAWASSGPTTSSIFGPQFLASSYVPEDLSIERLDNVHQLAISIERRDSPSMLRRKLSLGGPVFNYGAANWFRTQIVDQAVYSDPFATEPDPVAGYYPAYSDSLIRRNALITMPDVWFRAMWRTLRVEFESSVVAGRMNVRADIDDPGDELTGDTIPLALLGGGYALEFKYGIFDDDFHIGFDHGYASGDALPADDFDLSASAARPFDPSTGYTLNGFQFNPAYMQDLLLFKQVMGTVSNAAYFRPWAAYHFFGGNMSARVDIQYALAHEKTATPGNKLNYGLELDGAIRYHGTQDPIFVQMQYGILFPFGAFNAPNAAGDTVDASAAQTIQAQIGVRF